MTFVGGVDVDVLDVWRQKRLPVLEALRPPSRAPVLGVLAAALQRTGVAVGQAFGAEHLPQSDHLTHEDTGTALEGGVPMGVHVCRGGGGGGRRRTAPGAFDPCRAPGNGERRGGWEVMDPRQPSADPSLSTIDHALHSPCHHSVAWPGR